MKQRAIIWLLGLFLLTTTSIMAQNSDSTVPDVTGLNVPQATAALNTAGLRLGEQAFAIWTEASGLTQNTISEQSVAAGATLAPGSTVDVTILVTNNVRLLYDDNDLTVVNLVGDNIDVADLSFKAVDGNQPEFNAADWSGTLRGKQCLQLWTVNRNSSKDLPECESIQNWLSTRDTAKHFWTVTNGVSHFEVLLDGEVKTTCEAAPPNSQDNVTSCEFYLPAGQGEILPYLYIVYTTERLVVMNPSQDKWLRPNKTSIANQNQNNQLLGKSFKIGDPKVFGSPDIVSDIKRLAPGQCLLFKRDDVANDPLPESCQVITQLDLPANQLFWVFDFELTSQDKTRHICTGAIADKRTICIMPR